MCIRITNQSESFEFSVDLPLESQIVGATEIQVSYDPSDPKIPYFVSQIEKMVCKGSSCSAEIKVDTKNILDGLRLERALERLQNKLGMNEVVKKLVGMHSSTDKKLQEISKICSGDK